MEGGLWDVKSFRFRGITQCLGLGIKHVLDSSISGFYLRNHKFKLCLGALSTAAMRLRQQIKLKLCLGAVSTAAMRLRRL